MSISGLYHRLHHSGKCGPFCKFADCESVLRIHNTVCKTLEEVLGTLWSAYIGPLRRHLQICVLWLKYCSNFPDTVSSKSIFQSNIPVNKLTRRYGLNLFALLVPITYTSGNHPFQIPHQWIYTIRLSSSYKNVISSCQFAVNKYVSRHPLFVHSAWYFPKNRPSLNGSDIRDQYFEKILRKT